MPVACYLYFYSNLTKAGSIMNENSGSLFSAVIAAVSTPLGSGGIGVIRISGPKAQAVADKVFRGKKKIGDLAPYQAVFGAVYDSAGMKLDECVALNFVAPNSFTGENVVELSCHGGQYILKRVLEALFAAGARPADAGEFTKRAFLNGKLDLTQAESVMELICATGERAREAALAAKDGALSKGILGITEALVAVGAELSAWADYPDDDIPQVDEKLLKTKLEEAGTKLADLLLRFETGRLFRDGVNTVIAGRPNAGKSTLMNLLSGCERSIVTEIAGTTRDIVEERVMLGDIPLILADTAGLRQTEDPVERIGVRMAKDRLSSAELILAVFDASVPLNGEDHLLLSSLTGRPAIAVINKSDLPPEIDVALIQKSVPWVVEISALRGYGLEELKEAVQKLLKTDSFVSGTTNLCTQRQRESVRQAESAVSGAYSALTGGFTLDAVTVEVEQAIAALLELTGQRVSEAVIDSVFSRFCVGK